MKRHKPKAQQCCIPNAIAPGLDDPGNDVTFLIHRFGLAITRINHKDVSTEHGASLLRNFWQNDLKFCIANAIANSGFLPPQLSCSLVRFPPLVVNTLNCFVTLFCLCLMGVGFLVRALHLFWISAAFAVGMPQGDFFLPVTVLHCLFWSQRDRPPPGN